MIPWPGRAGGGVRGGRSNDLLVVAGEPSGDRMAAMVAREARARGVRCWGLGGRACDRAGVETVGDAAQTAVMGALDVARRLPAIGGALGRIVVRALREPPAAALLVNFTELNARLGRVLRRLGTRVLWCAAPQAWAWRPGRLRSIGPALDKLAVILPFEEALWRSAGVDARYVGHPSLDVRSPARASLRARLGLGEGAAVAVLPGSRAGEVARLCRPLCEGAARLLREGSAREARLLVAPWLDARSRGVAAEAAQLTGISIVEGDAEDGAAPLLGAFDVSLCASGTASLEAALAGAAPVVAYRMDPLGFAVARRLVKTPHIGLPNVLLRRRAFPELLQDEVTAERLAAAARGVLARRGEAGALAEELRALLAHGSREPFGRRVAGMLFEEGWLSDSTSETSGGADHDTIPG